ncbi:MAG: sulfatase [Thermoanaerobaculia bacterium]
MRLPGPPRVETVTLDDERRPSVILPSGGWSWRTRVPDGGRLQVGAGSAGEAPLEVTIAVREKERREVLEVARRVDRPGWLDLSADLSAYGGEEVTLELSAAGEAASGEVAWGPVALTAGGTGSRDPGPPNVLFILVDTLRYDHLTVYGYDRETSPEMERRLAGAGAVLEHAYAQAPWTLPSVVSYMISRHPGEVLGEDQAAFGIPEGLASLPEVMAGLGYRTAGFFANPVLHDGNGFGRGFETFYSPEGLAALERHADSVNRRAIPWLAAHRDRPFFAYVHYVDPHDPYTNPDVVDGRSPYFEDPGGMGGRWVHGIYAGQVPLDDVEREVRHLTALYDTEIRYVDRAIGELLASLPEEVLADTLVVLTSDHGEELYDHGGWKHGHTLYEDQIHVPLLFRWDGRIPAGRRLPGTVRLLDVAPTIVEAAGGEAPEGWQGVSLLPALTGEGRLPRLTAFAQHLSAGPLRAAAVLDGRKLILFNREEPFEPTNDLQRHLHSLDMGRLERLELYDLDADRRERDNLLAAGAGAAEERAGRLAPLVYRRLDRALPGLRALPEGLAPGAVLSGELTFQEAPEGVVPLFLGPGDRLELDGRRVRFDITGEAVPKGFRILGAGAPLEAAALALDGEPLPPGRLRLGAGDPFTGRPVAPAALEAEALPAPETHPGLRLWAPAGPTSRAAPASDRTRESLRALGYVE